MTGDPIRDSAGWWWPADDNQAEDVILREVQYAIPWILDHVSGRDCVVQAGGNVGVYAVTLAEYFSHVRTAEPDPVNLRCLVRNVIRNGRSGRIAVVAGGFWSENTEAHIHIHEPGNCGAHQVRPGGDISLVTIDSLNLTACDAIWLDIEGSELPALKGAVETIRRFHPVIACEEKGIGRLFGYGDAEIEDWLSQQGYSFVDRHYNDRLYKYDL